MTTIQGKLRVTMLLTLQQLMQVASNNGSTLTQFHDPNRHDLLAENTKKCTTYKSLVQTLAKLIFSLLAVMHQTSLSIEGNYRQPYVHFIICTLRVHGIVYIRKPAYYVLHSRCSIETLLCHIYPQKRDSKVLVGDGIVEICFNVRIIIYAELALVS